MPLALAVSNNENTIMLASAPSVVSQNSQFFLPTVTDIVKSHVEEYKPYFDSPKVSFCEWGMHQILCMTKD